MTKLWANSGDSHFLEPDELWRDNLPPHLAERVPRSVKDPDGEWETVHIDSMAFRRKLPTSAARKFMEMTVGAPGGKDVSVRINDLDNEGVWGEVVYPSLGLWCSSFRSPELLREALRVSNDWAYETLEKASPRLVTVGQVSTLDVGDAVKELERIAEMGYRAVFLPTLPHPMQKDYNYPEWEPFWDACDAANMVIAFHIGSEPVDLSDKTRNPGQKYRGPGGAVLNYTETTFEGQRAVMKLVASGALDKRPNLKVLVSEGGATWVPFIADRMEEGYRQHHMAVRPKLERPIREQIFSQVYASFQHDKSAVAAATYMGYHNVMWGSDYPHMEGTFGHTQETLHELFDDADPKVAERVMRGTFYELFPDVPQVPVEEPVGAGA
ncbi:amidohydrolase family protein [Mycobacterium paraseoulense]|uniref:Amidohydrolase n=1 Tax=Mycobacterium paraseoulense TaxID=590652 RepID=A0A1X0IGB0_9MYCO|nr:amidohydrolase family protein [Mycobacterium paraseoulense]MCV7393892.1 amidohydrolase [Mycobacterium paraseoulense]ORB45577.1 amidohydrolase [Mycobacterium paraseoulense]